MTSSPAAPTRPTHPSNPSVARSWLLVPAATSAAVAAADTSTADIVVLDLEDGVRESDKDTARAIARARLQDGHRDWVRINDTTTPHWERDLEALTGLDTLAGVMLAKTESAEQVAATTARLGERIPIVAMIESAAGLEDARGIAHSPATLRLAFGSGDFRRDTGAGDDPVALAYARSRMVVVSRAARVDAPIDGPTHPGPDGDLRSGIAVGATAGMTGKLCLRAAHTDIINTALAPSPTDITLAEEVISRLGEDGAHIEDGSDRPKLERALRTRYLARTFGI
ncbi:probable citrate lyase beta subunit (plasmid) [Rhodococcus jostii RHA1]|uniref:Probable citrate lyase beta subunit n=1 Tax=Rhodococcus jostii (strain RHA1) TaxID=101510 RepID=Q0RY02_RHOJR|nr:aldolase/citrate lyase family protein [Rhodococcus jostii]ABG99834.1 probable citrate lyase beta subunit [Rhodococcus jostii RHA1]